MKLLLVSLIDKMDVFEEDVKELEINVTSAENITFELSELSELIRDNLTQAQNLLMSSESKLREEIWRQLETTIRLNRRLRRKVPL